MRPNNLTRDIAKGVSKYARPSLKLIGQWREEWKLKGLDFKCSFESYKRHKVGIWHKQRKEKKANDNRQKTILRHSR